MIRLIALLILLFTGAARVVAADNVPVLNIEPSCRASVALNQQSGGSGTVEQCLEDEKSARAEVVKGWSSFPSGDRTRCTAEVRDFAASYVELLECLTMARDASAMERAEKRKQAPKQ